MVVHAADCNAARFWAEDGGGLKRAYLTSACMEDKELTHTFVTARITAPATCGTLGIQTSDALEEGFACAIGIFGKVLVRETDRRFQYLIPDMDWLGPVPVCLKCMGIVSDELPDEEWQ